jgi:ABC-type microcin C transport system duplicated ATPase subunit YejF
MILITHDLTALDRLDEIAVVVDGRVVQRGTHAELLAREGWYRAAALATVAGPSGSQPDHSHHLSLCRAPGTRR